MTIIYLIRKSGTVGVRELIAIMSRLSAKRYITLVISTPVARRTPFCFFVAPPFNHSIAPFAQPLDGTTLCLSSASKYNTRCNTIYRVQQQNAEARTITGKAIPDIDRSYFYINIFFSFSTLLLFLSIFITSLLSILILLTSSLYGLF